MRESLYEMITKLNETPEKKIYLVRHVLSHVCYVKKVFAHQEDISIYEQLLRHPHVNMTCVKEVENTEEACILIEEFVNGTTLEYEMSAREISIEEIQSIFMQLFDVLAHLHAQTPPIVHRDIKPGNIMLEKGIVKLIDFEIARRVSTEKNRDTQIIGSVGYAAPEQYGFRQSDQRSDIYALGVLLKELLEQRPEYGLYQTMIERCMEMDPNRRYPSMDHLRKAFIKYSGLDRVDEPISMEDANATSKLPGLRGETGWKKAAFLLYYPLTLGFAMNLTVEPPVEPYMLYLERFGIWCMLVLALWICCNTFRLQEIFPFRRSENKAVRILNGFAIWVAFSFVILLGVALLAGIIESFLKTV